MLPPTPMNVGRIEQILTNLGLNLNDPNFEDTGSRWLAFLQSYIQPYDPRDDLSRSFSEPVEDAYDHAMIVQVGIPYHALCAHHLLPVLGTAHVGYIPQRRVVGLSKLTRLVHGIAHSAPSLQEDVGNKVVGALMEHLEPLGAICVISAEHGCMSARGVEKPTGQIRTVTSSIKGVFINRTESRQEFYQLVAQKT